MIINIKIILIIILFIILLQLMNEPFSNIDYKDDYLNGIDIIYWINLDRSVNRRNDIEEMFQDKSFYNIPNKRIPAIDGKTEYLDSILNYYFYNFKYEIDNKEYGCILSHLLAILEFNNSNYEIALIIEDDMTIKFKQHWKEPIKTCISNAPDDWEILQLTYLTYNNYIPSDMYTRSSGGSGTGAYLISKKGANKLINLLYNNNKFNLNDKGYAVADYLLYNHLISYKYKYPYFIPANKDSEIHPDHIDSLHIPATNTLEIILQEVINFSNNIMSSI